MSDTNPILRINTFTPTYAGWLGVDVHFNQSVLTISGTPRIKGSPGNPATSRAELVCVQGGTTQTHHIPLGAPTMVGTWTEGEQHAAAAFSITSGTPVGLMLNGYLGHLGTVWWYDVVVRATTFKR